MSNNKHLVAVKTKIDVIRNEIDEAASNLQAIIDDVEDNEEIDRDPLDDALSSLESANDEAASALRSLDDVALPDEPTEGEAA